MHACIDGWMDGQAAAAAALEVVAGMWIASRNGQSESSKTQLVSITLS